MFILVSFVLELILLFLLSRTLTRKLSRFLSPSSLSFLFLPGIIIHELSHFLVASILFVGVSDIEFLPKIIENRVKLGSVLIEKTDPIRRLIIGFSPILFGLLIFLGLSYFLPKSLNLTQNWILLLSLFYLLFVIGNTMFSSKKDTEGAFLLLTIFIAIFVVFYFLGFRIELKLPQVIFERIIISIKTLDFFLFIPIAVDAIIIGILKII